MADEPLPEVRPEAAGLDPTRVERVAALAESGVERGLYLGAAWAIVQRWARKHERAAITKASG